MIGKLLERARHWWGVWTRPALHLSLGFLTIGAWLSPTRSRPWQLMHLLKRRSTW